MQYTVSVSLIQVVGTIWQPGFTCAQEQKLTAGDIANMLGEDTELTREDVENWINSHFGDFQEVTDFSASLEVNGQTVEFPWASEESEFLYHDCVYGSED